MDPKDRHERWEQEQLNEFEEHSVRQQEELLNYVQRLPILEEQDFMEDHTEQLNRIRESEQWEEDQQQERNDEQLLQHEQWENLACLLQQMK